MLGLIQGVANIFRQKAANKALEKLLGQDPTYQQNPLAAQQLAMAHQLYNGRMEGAASEERNIFQNQANTIGAVNKNATDSSQALALAAATQGKTNQAFNNLQQQESQNKYSMLQNLNQAYSNMINEGDKVYNDKVRRFGDLASIRGQQQQNKTNALNGVFNGLESDINGAMKIMSGGGFGNFFGGGQE